MKTSLIGYTGFVGGNLQQQSHFDDLFNSKNISEIAHKKYDLLVCAGAPGTKWIANMHPEEDRQSIERLISALSKVQTKRLILISTIDVYPVPRHVDEESLIDSEKNTAYGKNRYDLEQFVRDNFADAYVIRLPALFGSGLKKNAIYDMIHDHEVEKLNPKSKYQFYYLNRLWKHIEIAMKNNIHTMNLVTEPIEVGVVYSSVFQKNLPEATQASAAAYDVRTRFGQYYGGKDYIYFKDEILKELTTFIRAERAI